MEDHPDDAEEATAPVETIKTLTEAYNALVPQATALGIKCKHHKSPFETKGLGQRQLAKLREQIALMTTPTT